MDEKLNTSSNHVSEKNNKKFEKNQILITAVVLIIALFAAGTLLLTQKNTSKKALQITPVISSTNPPTSKDTQTPSDIPVTTIITQNLDIPWSLDFFPDGRGIFTQRPGSIKMLDENGEVTDFNFEISEVKHIGEGGLLGIVVDPIFETNKFVYVYYTYSSNGSNTLNRVVRYRFADDNLIDKRVLVDKIPGASNHNGGRIKFGPDGFLYITTGDAQNPSQSQDRKSLAGKILRVDREGKPASDNPFNSSIYSYGHRNPQGISWNSNRQLYETEHGPLAHDEINIIIKGGNYGWPTIQGTQSKEGMISPIKESGIETWAPSGAEFYDDRLFYAGLRGTALFEAKTENLPAGRKGAFVNLTEHFKNEFGRVRDVVLGPDNLLYILTSNTDGRGTPSGDDDKIIRVNPQKL